MTIIATVSLWSASVYTNWNYIKHCRVQHRLENIIFWVGQAASKIDWPRRRFHLPRQHFHLPHHSGASMGLVQLAPLPFFAEFTCNLQWGKWLCCTLKHIFTSLRNRFGWTCISPYGKVLCRKLLIQNKKLLAYASGARSGSLQHWSVCY